MKGYRKMKDKGAKGKTIIDRLCRINTGRRTEEPKGQMLHIQSVYIIHLNELALR